VDLDGCVPMRWPCGPLDIERGRRRAGFGAREAEALRAWTGPAALDLLTGSPVNGLVVTWADGSETDDEQQRTLAPLVAAARGRGLAVVGRVWGTADLRRAAGAARAAGLAALATESRDPLAGLDVLRFRKRGAGDGAPTGFLGDVDAVWPGMRPLKLDEAIDAVSGATSRPWIDSNVWYVRIARSLLEPRAVWLSFDAPDAGAPIAADAYLQAIADTEIGGARWVVSLDPALRLGLSEGRAEARETWARIGRGLAFFREHAAWAGFSPVGQIGVISDYAGTNEFLSFELVNLLARRSALYQVLGKGRVQGASFEGLDSVLYADEAPPGRELARRLYAFAEAGGTLITPPGWQERGVPDESVEVPRFRVSRCGRGRLAVAREAFADPELLAEDAELLTSHRLDRVRVFNLGTGLFQYGASGDGRQGVLHALAFPTPYPRGEMTAWFRRPWATARVFTVDAGDATPARRTPVGQGVEFHLPAPPVYCALEMSG
jgi:hypothetical protein